MPVDKPALAGRLAANLAERAKREGEPMDLDPAAFEDALDRGIGSAFGVRWDAEGNPTRDDQEPEPGFPRAWLGRRWAKHGRVSNDPQGGAFGTGHPPAKRAPVVRPGGQREPSGLRHQGWQASDSAEVGAARSARGDVLSGNDADESKPDGTGARHP